MDDVEADVSAVHSHASPAADLYQIALASYAKNAPRPLVTSSANEPELAQHMVSAGLVGESPNV